MTRGRCPDVATGGGSHGPTAALRLCPSQSELSISFAAVDGVLTNSILPRFELFAPQSSDVAFCLAAMIEGYGEMELALTFGTLLGPGCQMCQNAGTTVIEES